MMQRRFSRALSAAALSAAVAALPLPAAAEALSADTREALEAAENAKDSAAFSAALRSALAADPAQKEAILQEVMTLYPEESATLLLSALYVPSPGSSDAAGTAADAPGSAVAAPATPPSADAAAAPQVESEEKDPWSGSVALGATVRTGNTDNAGVSGDATLRYDEGRWHHRGKVAGDYLRNRTETQEQFVEGEFETRYDLDARNFTYGFARYEDDRFSGYDYEFLSSAGLGRHLILEEGHEWTVTLGPSYRVAQPGDSDSQEREVGARFTNLLSWDLSDSAKVQNETEAQGDRERVRVNNDVGLKVRLVEQLSAQLSFGVEYRSDAPDDSEHSDTTTRAAIVYDF